jgi:sulfhydrogenase subunit beta (sulfur reductase)
MDRVFISKLKPLLAALAEKMEVYAPRKADGHYTYARYEAGTDATPELNEIRVCTPLKEFLFPLRELAAVFPKPAEPQQVRPFAVYGVKACDLRSLEILDTVFLEKEFEDPLYRARRDQMFVVSSDCLAPGESCLCNLFGGKPYAESGFDLNISAVPDGFIIQAGSAKGKNFLFAHAALFGDVPDALLAERAELRETVEKRLAEATADIRLEAPIRQIVEAGYGSDVFDECAATCVECQACTRVCPTCHCFYLYDAKQKEYFAKMKMWDSCMRFSYAAVAGGANPRKVLGDRLRHRFLHKFVYFPDRYGLEMCVGCGRCLDAEAGAVDIREVLKRLNDERLNKGKRVVKAAK